MNGVPVVYESYPDGEAGIQRSIAWMAKSVRAGAKTPEMKAFAAHVLRLAGFPEKAFARFTVWLGYVRKNVAYSADCPGTEQIQSAAISLCVEGAPICIPMEDCDGLVVALATLIMAGGYEVEIVRQYFGEAHQQHVLMRALDTETGAWVNLDPSSKMPAGQKAHAEKETYVSPRDDQAIGLVGAPDAEFVGIGALPRLEWKGDRWIMQDASKGLGHGACCASCAKGGACESGLGQSYLERNWQLHTGPVPPEVASAARGTSVFAEKSWWHVHPTGEVHVNRAVHGVARGGAPGGHAPGGHAVPHHGGFQHGRRFHGGRWWDWTGDTWVIVDMPAAGCGQWGDPIVPSAALREEGVAQMVASGGHPVTETWTDGVMYLFEALGDHGTIDGVRASLTVRPCVGLATSGVGAPLARVGVGDGLVPYQTVSDGQCKAGLRYRLKMQLSFDYDPSDKVIVEQLHVDPELEARARFAADWTIESMVPDGAVRQNVGKLPYIQNWIMQGIPKHDLVLADDAQNFAGEPFVIFLGASVQASSPTPATPPQPNKAPPPEKPKDAPASFGVGTAIVVVGLTAGVGGIVWHGWKEGWFRVHPSDAGARFRKVAA